MAFMIVATLTVMFYVSTVEWITGILIRRKVGRK